MCEITVGRESKHNSFVQLSALRMAWNTHSKEGRGER